MTEKMILQLLLLFIFTFFSQRRIDTKIDVNIANNIPPMNIIKTSV